MHVLSPSNRRLSLVSAIFLGAPLIGCGSDSNDGAGTGAGSTTGDVATTTGGVASADGSPTTGATNDSTGVTTTTVSSTTGGTTTSATMGGTTGAATTGVGGATSTGVGEGGTGTGSTGQPDPGVAPTAIANLTIEPNPNSVISCIVSWTTDQAASSTVQFGVGGYEWEIVDSVLTTTHRVVVIGMHAQQAYAIQAISGNSGGSVSAEGDFTTGALPSDIPVGTVMINDTTKAQPGWTLMNVQKGDGTTGARSASPPMAVMYDEGGQPVWYYIDTNNPDIGGAVSTQLTDVGVLIGPTWNTNLTTGVMPREVDFEGNVVWECPASFCGGSKSFSHHAHKMPNGNYILLEDSSSGQLRSPLVHEVTPDNQEVWNLMWTDLVPPPQGASGDWCHGNSVSTDLANDTVWINCRWVGLIKVSYSSKALQWFIPASYGGSGLGDFTFVPADSQFSDTHDPEIHQDDNTILFFDNGGYASGAQGGTTAQFRSRAVEYTIDEAAKTATLTWEFPGSFAVPDSWYQENWYTPFWGDADRLPNGNVLVAAGIRSPSVESRVFEVTKADGQVVWEFRFPVDYGVYRADRVIPPLVRPIAN